MDAYTKTSWNMLVKGLASGLIQILIVAILLLLPAGLLPGGTWKWGRGLELVAGYGLLLEFTVYFLYRYAPAGLRSRLKPVREADQSKTSRVAARFLGIMIIFWMLFIPLDVFVLQLFPVPSVAFSLFGLALCLVAYLVVVLTIYQNQFATPHVEDQTTRGQYLVHTGIYGIVRHPMYSGIIMFLAGIALWLQSYAALLALPLICFALVPRIMEEERMLIEVLPDYLEYQKKVRYRLLPFIW